MTTGFCSCRRPTPALRNRRAWICVALGDFSGARHDADRALESGPHRSNAPPWSGSASARQNRRECLESLHL